MSQATPEDPGDMIHQLMRSASASTGRVTRPRSAPQREWVCGYAELGQGCSSGPTQHGRCGRCQLSTAESSSSPSEPLPMCIPRRTAAWQRQALRINLAILTAAALLLGMWLPSREQNFVPGELSAGHAQIMATTLVSQRCGLCHPASHQNDPASDNHSFIGDSANGPSHENHLTDEAGANANETGEPSQSKSFWLGVLNDTARRLVANDGRQDAMCMQCHKTHMPRAADRNPHDLSAEQWRTRLTARQSTPVGQLVVSSGVSERARLPVSIETKTSCATCHNEHHGRGFDIKLIADDRCQACHSRRFESLVSGHPEFNNFPMRRERALAFSHQAHAEKHFTKKGRQFDCRACHVDTEHVSPLGGIARTVSFETACASCHTEPIRAATVDGWAVLQLPSIDGKTAVKNQEFSDWPQSARFGFEGQVSPVLRALLASDEAMAEVLKLVPGSGLLTELPNLDGQRERVTIAVALATQRLLRDTASSGQAAWQSRLERVTQTRLARPLNEQDRALIAAMCRGVAPDLFRRAEQEWFHDSSKLVDASTNLPTARSQLTVVPPPGGRLVSTQDLLPERDLLPEKDTSPGEDLSAGNDLLSGNNLSSAGDDLLSGNPGKESDSLLDSPVKSERQPNQPASNQPASNRPVNRPVIKGVTHLASGGWYLDEQTLAVRYMPTGHADQTLAAWCTWWAMIEAVDTSSATAVTPRSTSQSRDAAHLRMTMRIPGGCAECHLLQPANFAPSPAIDTRLTSSPTKIPATPPNSLPTTHNHEATFSLPALWRAPMRSAVQKEFTKFNHTPHLQLPAVNDCRYCHKLEQPANSALNTPLYSAVNASPAATQPFIQHGSEFAAMSVTQCTACHRPGGASDRCTQCHNYHVSENAIK